MQNFHVGKERERKQKIGELMDWRDGETSLTKPWLQTIANWIKLTYWRWRSHVVLWKLGGGGGLEFITDSMRSLGRGKRRRRRRRRSWKERDKEGEKIPLGRVLCVKGGRGEREGLNGWVLTSFVNCQVQFASSDLVDYFYGNVFLV